MARHEIFSSGSVDSTVDAADSAKLHCGRQMLTAENMGRHSAAYQGPRQAQYPTEAQDLIAYSGK